MSSLPNLLAETDVWANEFFGLGADERFVVLLVGISCITVVIIVLSGIVGGVVSSANRRNAEYELKREMLDRGMTAEEIAQVIEAAPLPEGGFDRWVASWCKGKKRTR